MNLLFQLFLLSIVNAQSSNSVLWTSSTVAGNANGNYGMQDGVGASATFFNPQGIAVDSKGNLFVVESSNLVRKIDKNGLVKVFAGVINQAGHLNGPALNATFSGPSGLVIDLNDNLFIADQGSNEIRFINTTSLQVGLYAGNPAGNSGTLDGVNATQATFSPAGLAFTISGRLIIGDRNNLLVRIVEPLAGAVSTVGSFGTSNYDGVGTAAHWYGPKGIAIDQISNIAYVADGAFVRRFKCDNLNISTINVTTVPANGLLSVSQLAVGPDSNIYLTDSRSNQIKMVTPSGVTAVIAGTGAGSNPAVDGAGLNSTFYGPTGIVFGPNYSLYITEAYGHRIRKLTPSCSPGYNLTALSCFVCPPGTYSDVGLVCNQCPTGFTSYAGSASCPLIVPYTATYAPTTASLAIATTLTIASATATTSTGASVTATTTTGASATATTLTIASATASTLIAYATSLTSQLLNTDALTDQAATSSAVQVVTSTNNPQPTQLPSSAQRFGSNALMYPLLFTCIALFVI